MRGRILVATAGAAAIAGFAGFAAGAFRSRAPEPSPVAVAPLAVAPLAVAAAPATPSSPVEPIPPSPYAELARPRVPAGILARAADARALERGPTCPPPAEQRELPRCVPEDRESIDIDWHVAREP